MMKIVTKENILLLIAIVLASLLAILYNRYTDLQLQIKDDQIEYLSNLQKKEKEYENDRQKLQDEIDTQVATVAELNDSVDGMQRKINSYKPSAESSSRDKARIEALGQLLQSCSREYKNMATEADRLNNRLHIIKQWESRVYEH